VRFAYDGEVILARCGIRRRFRYEPNPKGLRARDCGYGIYSALARGFRPTTFFLTTSTSEAYSYVFGCCAILAMNCYSGAELSPFSVFR